MSSPLFRSSPMSLVQLFVQVDAAHNTVVELGKLGVIQFRDLAPDVSAFQRNFVNDVKRCDELERKLRFFEAMIEREQAEAEAAGIEDTLVSLDADEDAAARRDTFKLDELETAFDDAEKDLVQMNTNQEMLARNYNELTELRFVLQKDGAFFSDAGTGSGAGDSLIVESSDSRSLLGEGGRDDGDQGIGGAAGAARAVKLGFVTGTIARARFAAFERVLWRQTRGNLFMKHAEIDIPLKDPSTTELLDKNVFIIFFQGELAQGKIKKICESFAANLYPCPEGARERDDLLEQVNSRMQDLQNVLDRTNKHRTQVIRDLARNVPAWREFVAVEKSVFHQMNLFNYDVGRKCLIAEGWTPKGETDNICSAMRRATESSGALVPSILSVIKSKEEPPTHFETNKFTKAFHSIVEAYGVARYGEVNPAVFAIMTFPFLFGVMFGDVGHGFLLFLFALWMCMSEKKLEAMVPADGMTIFSGRYLILLMSVFAIYAGALYNEAFAIGIDFGGSRWLQPGKMGTVNDTNFPGVIHTDGPTGLACAKEDINPLTMECEWGIRGPEFNFTGGKRQFYNESANAVQVVDYDSISTVYYEDTQGVPCCPKTIMGWKAVGNSSNPLFEPECGTEEEPADWCICMLPSTPGPWTTDATTFQCPYGEERTMRYNVDGNTYLFGADPAWKGAANTLTYFNSLKMKMSVILGVGQMSLGIVMSLLNGLHNRKAVDIYAEFVPQIIFMQSLFGYMCFVIFLKWFTPSPIGQPKENNTNNFPMVINLMIDMFLSPTKATCSGDYETSGPLSDSDKCGVPAFDADTNTTKPNLNVPGDRVFAGQVPVQIILTLIAFVSVPWMLCTKPFVLKKQHQARARLMPTSVGLTDSGSDSDSGSDDDDEEEFEFGEVMVHQVIHTIEFVLGAISNTASYLRLWALSLAHAELSEVFWDRVFLASFGMDKGIGVIVFAGFAVWAGATVGVLLMMESLSAFLHALRLHWVEFMNKFYSGDGRKFTPYDHQAVLSGDDNDD